MVSCHESSCSYMASPSCPCAKSEMPRVAESPDQPGETGPAAGHALWDRWRPVLRFHFASNHFDNLGASKHSLSCISCISFSSLPSSYSSSRFWLKMFDWKNATCFRWERFQTIWMHEVLWPHARANPGVHPLAFGLEPAGFSSQWAAYKQLNNFGSKYCMFQNWRIAFACFCKVQFDFFSRPASLKLETI